MSEALLVKAEKAIEKQSKAILPMLTEKFRQLKPSEAVDLGLNAGLVYLGMKIFPGSLAGAMSGPIALKLAQSESEVAGASGVLGLVLLGAASAPDVVEGVFATTGITATADAILTAAPGLKAFPFAEDADWAAFLAGEKVFIEDEWLEKKDVVRPIIKDGALACPDGFRLVRGPSAAVCVRE